MAINPLFVTICGICTWSVMLLSLGWVVCIAVIAAYVILVLMSEWLWVTFLLPPLLLLHPSTLFLCFRHSWIFFRSTGFFLVFLYSSLKKNIVVSEISTPLYNLVLPNLFFLKWEKFILLRPWLFVGLVDVLVIWRWFLWQGSLLYQDSFHYEWIYRKWLQIPTSDLLYKYSLSKWQPYIYQILPLPPPPVLLHSVKSIFQFCGECLKVECHIILV